ncbi:MAG: energy-coupling factor transporter transmembrane protein EcfT [Treponema sp.]|jgi:energy-coupling factor transport system permease protein|nr:energy-coupling factor transporter transmembrane protein EcfT [Treponema sp.]
MFKTIRFFSIFAYTIGIFFFEWPLILFFAAINGVAMILCRITPPAAAKYVLSFLPFILLAAVFNFVLGYVQEAVYLTVRLVLVCNITQCYKKVVSANDLCRVIEGLCKPLKALNIDGKDVSLMVSISLAFIPVLRRDFDQIKLALKAKGMRLNAQNFKYLVKPFLVGILSRTHEISQAIRSKGYQ